MVIGKPNDVGAAQPVPRTGAANGSRAPAVTTVASGQDKVEGLPGSDSVRLSDAGRALISPGSDPEVFRADKVAEIRKAIDEGHYVVKAKVVADRMIREASELLESLTASGR